jgi:V8-like Glu-specific endopeptidase
VNRELFLKTKKGRAAGLIIILVLLASPASVVLGARTSAPAVETAHLNGTPQIPAWEPPLDPGFSKWDNAPITYDKSNGAVEQGRYPECKSCPPDETDYLKRTNTPCPDWPAATTVKIITTWPEASTDKTSCSGVMVDHSTVITAAHCVFTHTSGLCGPLDSCWAKEIDIYINFGTEQEDESHFEKILTWTAWTDNRDYNYDLAGIKLENPLGDEVCWLGFGYNNDNQVFLNNMFKHFHYIDENRLSTEEFSFDNPQEHRLFTNATSVNGQAGAGTYKNDTSVTIFSVLSHHHEIEGETFTAHTRITPDKFFALRDWINGGIKALNFMTYLPLMTD